ncbi:MAG: 2-dehydropantoate 2-reductase [Usitatibacter sp.]
MKICIVGAGAIGGYLGTRLALAGEEVTYLARGENLAAIRDHGMRILHGDGREEIVQRNVSATDWGGAGEYDLVILTVKAHQLGEIADRIESLCHADTVILPMQNGLPFWYFSNHGGELEGRSLEAVDPGGKISAAIDARRIIGCVVFIAAMRVGPGVVRYMGSNRFPMGELDGRTTPRIEKISAAFVRAGFEAPIHADIRDEVWLKLWGNVSFNPISSLTHATLSVICTDPDGRSLAARMMAETQAIAEKLGIRFRLSIDQRLDGAARVGCHKTSMLQDVEAGRALELDALVGSVVELGALVGVATPTIHAIYQAAKLLDRSMLADRVSVRTVPLGDELTSI